MSGIIPVLTGIGILDTISITPLAIVPLLAALGSARPLPTAGSLLAGIFIPYLAIGVLLLLGLSELFDVLTERFDQWLHRPDTLDMWLQLVIGVVALSAGFKLARSRENDDDRGAGEAIGVGRAFSIGFALTVVGIPGAVPYFAAIDQLLRADLALPGILGGLLYYNAICAAPLMAVTVVRVVLGERSDALFQRLAAWIGRVSHRAIVISLLVLGAILTLDAIAWQLGHPLIVVGEAQYPAASPAE